MKSTPNNQQWLDDRRDALLSMDKDKIIKNIKKYNPEEYEEVEDEVFWMGVHMMRTASTNLPEEERWKSIRWLADCGCGHFASDLTPFGLAK